MFFEFAQQILLVDVWGKFILKPLNRKIFARGLVEARPLIMRRYADHGLSDNFNKKFNELDRAIKLLNK